MIIINHFFNLIKYKSKSIKDKINLKVTFLLLKYNQILWMQAIII